MNEPMQDGLRNALGRLRESAAAEAAPLALEHELLKAFRTQHKAKPSRTRPMLAAFAAAIAASVVVAVVVERKPPVAVVAPEIPRAPAEPELTAVEADTPAVARRSKSPQKPRADRRALRLAERRPVPQRELRPQEFVELPYAPLFTQDDEGQIVRVSMPGSSVRRLGIPVMTDRVQADVLVGNDGLARAIRVVSNSGLNSIR